MSDVQTKRLAVENGLIIEPTYIAERGPRTATLSERMVAYNSPGTSIAVVNNGQIEWASGYGITDGSAPTSITPETRFYAASISKPVSALAALTLVQSGQLNLDEDVNRKLVSWRVPETELTRKQPITLRHLLNHTSGLGIDKYYTGYQPDEALPTLTQLLCGEAPAKTDPVRVKTEPGSRYRYSGEGYWVMQQLVEDVTGERFADVVQRVVLDPLGMQHSTFHHPLTEAYLAATATAHNNAGEPIFEAWRRFPAVTDGGLWTTPADLARHAIAVQQAVAGQPNSVLSPPLLTEMLTPQPGDHGLGPEIWGQGKATLFRHGGEGTGFGCVLMAFCHTGQGAVVMHNSADSYNLSREILYGIAEVYAWPYYRPVAKTIAKVELEQLLAYAGDYRLVGDPPELDRHREYAGPWGSSETQDLIYRVRPGGETLIEGESLVEGFALAITLPTGYNLTFYPDTPETFFTLEDELTVRFIRQADGPVNTLEVSFWNGLVLRGERQETNEDDA